MFVHTPAVLHRECNPLQNNTKVVRDSIFNSVGNIGGAAVSSIVLPAGLKQGSSIASAEKLIDMREKSLHKIILRGW